MIYLNKAYLTPNDIRRITQASVFIADYIILPVNIRIDPQLTEEESIILRNKVQELQEISAIKFWEIEGQSKLAPPLRKNDIVRSENNIVIPSRVYNDTYNEMIERLINKRQSFFDSSKDKSYDGLTEIVLGKQELWRFALTELLGANRILLDQTSTYTVQNFFSDLLRYEEFEIKILEKLAEKLNIPDVSQFSAKEIVQCRKFMPKFRKRLFSDTEGKFNEFMVSELVDKISEAIIDEYYDHIEKIARESKNIPRKLTEEIIWDILGYIFSSSIAIKYSNLFFNWISDSQDPSYQPLLMELRKMAKKARGGK